jgi:hypothetical protein
MHHPKPGALRTMTALAALLLRDLIRNRTAAEIADAIEVMIDAAIDKITVVPVTKIAT